MNTSLLRTALRGLELIDIKLFLFLSKNVSHLSVTYRSHKQEWPFEPPSDSSSVLSLILYLSRSIPTEPRFDISHSEHKQIYFFLSLSLCRSKSEVMCISRSYFILYQILLRYSCPLDGRKQGQGKLVNVIYVLFPWGTTNWL